MGTNLYGYAYDPIGNRLTASNNAEAIAYAANALNQYTNILSSASSAPLRETSPLFDADGNLTNYNGWSYTWDAENRLITAVNGATVVSNQYDYMSRRVAKTVGGVTRTFLYDGWAMIQESTGTQTDSYVYGIDLSGSMQGAGTIGGILSASLNGTQTFYFYDANGNVSDLTDANGSSLAHYEFDPYGNTIVASGTQAVANPFRFSTKYTDDETGLVYYGYRYCASDVGRWVSRDTIMEAGGVNVYEYNNNLPISAIDYLGLCANECTTGPRQIIRTNRFRTRRPFQWWFVGDFRFNRGDSGTSEGPINSCYCECWKQQASREVVLKCKLVRRKIRCEFGDCRNCATVEYNIDKWEGELVLGGLSRGRVLQRKRFMEMQIGGNGEDCASSCRQKCQRENGTNLQPGLPPFPTDLLNEYCEQQRAPQ
jgi:RHS repeat-associated protein